jgi:hypothetical protein
VVILFLSRFRWCFEPEFLVPNMTACVRDVTANAEALFGLGYRTSLRRLQEFDDSALFLAGNIGTETHVMDDYVPLRVIVHGRRSDIVAAQAVVGPELFAGKAHVRIIGDRAARLGSRFLFCFRFGQEVPARAAQEWKQAR